MFRAIFLNLLYWSVSIGQLIIAYKFTPIIAPYMVLSVVGIGIYIAYLTVKHDSKNTNR